ncbi:hypothetical protein NKG05_23335 [Oerskovia sp. M15]
MPSVSRSSTRRLDQPAANCGCARTRASTRSSRTGREPEPGQPRLGKV